MTRYPSITVMLTGTDGNAFTILCAATKAMREAELPKEEIREFVDEAVSGDYEHLIRTVMTWFDVE